MRLGAKATAVEAGPGGGFGVRVAAGTDAAASEPDGEGPVGTAADPAERRPGDRESVPGSADGAVISADAVVLAVPHGPAARLVPAAAAGGSARWAELGSAPDRERARHLRPAGHQAAAGRSGRLTGSVGIRQDPAGRRADWPVPRGIGVCRGQLRRCPGSATAGAVPSGARRALPRGARCPRDRFFCHQRTAGDIPPGTRLRIAPPGRCDVAARTGACGRVDRYRLAGHDGGGRAKRTQRCAGTDQPASRRRLQLQQAVPATAAQAPARVPS